MAKSQKKKANLKQIYFSPKITIFPFESPENPLKVERKTVENRLKWLDFNDFQRKTVGNIEKKPQNSINLKRVCLKSAKSPLKSLITDSFFDSRVFINIQTIHPQQFIKKYDKFELYRSQSAKKPLFQEQKPDISKKKTENSLKLGEFDFGRLNKDFKTWKSSYISQGIFPKRAFLKKNDEENELFKPFSREITPISKEKIRPLGLNHQNLNKNVENWLLMKEIEKIREFKALKLGVFKTKKSNSLGLINQISPDSGNRIKAIEIKEKSEKNEEKCKTFHFNVKRLDEKRVFKEKDQEKVLIKGDSLTPWINASDSFNESGIEKP